MGNHYNEVRKDLAMNINLVDGEEYRDILNAVANIASEILVKTLGPFASTTTIDDGASTYSTKDGWSVLNRLSFGDPVAQTLFKFIQRISFTLNSRVGDGTTTAVVAANQFIMIFNEFRRKLASTHKFIRQADLLDMIEDAKNEIVEELKRNAKNITKTDNGYEDIYKIAYVSSNRNEEISKLIKDIYDETDNPNIHVALSDTASTYSTIQRGYKLDTELLFDKYYLDSEDKYLLSSGALVWMFDHNVKYNEHFQVVQAILRYSNSKNKTAIIFAPSFDDTFISAMHGALLTVVKQGGIPSILLVRMPLVNSAMKNYASDFAVLTNTTLFNYTKVRMYNFLLKHSKGEVSEEDNEEFNNLFVGESYEEPSKIIETCMGEANRITIMKKSVLLEDFVKTKLYDSTLKEIQEAFDTAKNKISAHGGDVLNKEYMEAHLRLVKFMGNTGVIYVGGDSELNKKCTKDAVDDATLACRSAFENGYIRGLNLETISAAFRLANDKKGIEKEIYLMIAKTFFKTSLEVMKNKFRDEEFVPDWYDWGSEDGGAYEQYEEGVDAPLFCWKQVSEDAVPGEITPLENIFDLNALSSLERDMICIINTCVYYDFGFDIVTNMWETAGEGVINSVSTDIEILNATTSILSLLLSSNQLLSINKHFDKKASKEYTLSARKEDGYAFASGIADALKDADCSLFPKFTLLSTFGEASDGVDEVDMDDLFRKFDPTDQTNGNECCGD